MRSSLSSRLAAEAIGTAVLVAAVVGSGIMGARLAGGNDALALLANTIATGAALVALIAAFIDISGAHFNPAVSMAAGFANELPWREVGAYASVQIAGGIAGAAAAHIMFGLPLFSMSHRVRSGSAQVFSEFVATFGLLLVINGTARFRMSLVPFSVGAYIAAAYWFTASTSFANPAVTIARSLTDTFSGIRPVDAPLFILAQLAGATAAVLLTRTLRSSAASVPTRS